MRILSYKIKEIYSVKKVNVLKENNKREWIEIDTQFDNIL